jgi:hypothetical protein
MGKRWAVYHRGRAAGWRTSTAGHSGDAGRKRPSAGVVEPDDSVPKRAEMDVSAVPVARLDARGADDSQAADTDAAAATNITDEALELRDVRAFQAQLRSFSVSVCACCAEFCTPDEVQHRTHRADSPLFEPLRVDRWDAHPMLAPNATVDAHGRVTVCTACAETLEKGSAGSSSRQRIYVTYGTTGTRVSQ